MRTTRTLTVARTMSRQLEAPPAAPLTGRAMIGASAVRNVFPSRHGEIVALDGVDLSTAPGELVSILGQSGCGKSTLPTTASRARSACRRRCR
jgi:ABC-type glutathione transport system ATPase component